MRTLVLSMIVLSMPASALQTQGNTVTLNPDEQAACAAGGGCVLATRDAIRELVKQAYAKGAEPCRNQL